MILQDSFIINQCAAILLAAGASTRLGNPKQLLIHNGKSLITHAVDVIKGTELHPVIVILGSNASLIESEINNKKLLIRTNNAWQEGIASSIRCGINILQENYSACDGALIMVSDQPHITTELLNQLVNTQKITGKPMAACAYDNATGTPALFHKSVFPELLLLQGDKGAGNILKKRPQDVSIVPFPLGKFDIDTREDYEAFKKNTF